MNSFKQLTDEQARQVLEARSFPFALTECIYAFPAELRPEYMAPEKLLYARMVEHFNQACFENPAWIADPRDVYETFQVPSDVSMRLVCELVDRLFGSVSATLYRQVMPDGTWFLGVVRSLELARAA